MRHFSQIAASVLASVVQDRAFHCARTRAQAQEIVTIGFDSVRVLIVDDELSIRKMLAIMLTQSGIRCSQVSTPEEALDKLQNEAFDAVISDLRMGPVSGMDLLGEVRRVLAERLAPTQPGMRVLYTSGYTDSFIDGHGVLEAGTHLLHKPFTEEALTRKVRELLDASSWQVNPQVSSAVPVLAGEDASGKR
jgi:DNA-binding response OmpR family regulator